MRDWYTSGAHGQNMRCSCAFHPTHWHGVPRIFLTAPLSYAAETYAMPKVSSFRATKNSQPVLCEGVWGIIRRKSRQGTCDGESINAGEEMRLGFLTLRGRLIW